MDRKIPLEKGDLIYDATTGQIGYVNEVETPSSPITARYDVTQDASTNECEVFTIAIDAIEEGEHLKTETSAKIWEVFEDNPHIDRRTLYLYLPDKIQSQLYDWGPLITAIDEEIFLIQQQEFAVGGIIGPPTP